MRKYPTHNTPAGTAVLLVVMAAVLCYVVYMYATVPGMEWD